MKSVNDISFRRKFLAMAVGNIMEWFDFSSFGALADVIGHNFFPGDGSTSLQLLKALAVFGAAFLMRPVGGIVMGRIGDTLGRKKALEISIALMLLPSFCIGCLPTYAQVGWISSVALVFFRLLQGLAAGGELIGAFLYTLEATKGRDMGYWGGACKATGNFGTTLGFGMVTLLRAVLSTEQLDNWGWRIPFWFGILFGIVGIRLRASLKEEEEVVDEENVEKNHSQPSQQQAYQQIEAPEDTQEGVAREIARELVASQEEEEEKVRKSSSPSLVGILYGYQSTILCLIFIVAFWSCAYYTCCVWIAYFLQDATLSHSHGQSIQHVAWMLTFVMNLCLVISLPLGGWFGDWVGTQVSSAYAGIVLSLQIALLIFLAIVLPAFCLILTKELPWVMIGQGLLILPISLFGGNLPAFMIHCFPKQVRYTGMGIGYNVANALFAGTTSLIQTALVLSSSSSSSTSSSTVMVDDGSSSSHQDGGTTVFQDARIRPAYYLILITILSFLSLTIYHTRIHAASKHTTVEVVEEDEKEEEEEEEEYNLITIPSEVKETTERS